MFVLGFWRKFNVLGWANVFRSCLQQGRKGKVPCFGACVFARGFGFFWVSRSERVFEVDFGVVLRCLLGFVLVLQTYIGTVLELDLMTSFAYRYGKFEVGAQFSDFFISKVNIKRRWETNVFASRGKVRRIGWIDQIV